MSLTYEATVFDPETRQMDPKFLSPTEAGKLVAEITGRNSNRHTIHYLVREGALRPYYTPNGLLVTFGDILATCQQRWPDLYEAWANQVTESENE